MFGGRAFCETLRAHPGIAMSFGFRAGGAGSEHLTTMTHDLRSLRL
jgi:hypothetical protein